MCIRLSGTKYWYCANDKHDHACHLKAKDMIIMVRPGLTVWWSVLNYSKWCTGIKFCIYYGFFFVFKLSGTSILKSSMLLVKNDDLLYQIELDFAVCLDLVYGCLVYILFIIFSVKSAVLMDCIKGISISTDIYIHVCYS